MAYYPNNTVPISTTGPHANRTQELPARAQRTNQVQYVEGRLRNGLSPLAVAGVAALLTQLDTMQTLPGVSVSLVTEVAGYRRTLTCQNNAWDGHDLTHQFLDERSTTMLGPSQGTSFEQEASLCMVPASVATMPPPQMVALPPPAPNPVPMTPTYSGSPAFGTSYRAPHMVLQTTTNAPVSDREPSGSRLPPIPNPELTGRSTSEQAVTVALQAVANYPNSTDFVRAVEQRIPGLATYLRAAAQPAGCDPPAPLVETASMDMEIVAGPSNSASAAPGTREEAGRKRLTEETVSVTPAGSVTESPTSRPPPDKRADVPRPQLKSVVIPRPPYRVGHLGRSAPQMSLADAIEQYGDPDAGSEVSSVPSGTNPIDMSLEIPETVEEAHPPAFLPPSDDVSGSVVTNDSKRIWMAAEHLYPSQCAIKKRTPPTETEQKEINRTTIPAQVTRSLRPRDADMSEQAWEQRAREQLPMTTNDYMAPLQHNITEQFPARYVLREGETWEANARYARNLRSLKPLLKAALQRARYCMAVDSTCRSDLPIDNLMPDVLVLTMPLSRFAEVAEMVGAIYDPNLRGSQKEPPPQRTIFANFLDHMACEGLLHDLDAIMSNVRRLGDIAALVNEVVGAMERAAWILWGRLGVLALFVSPPGFMYWPRSLQQFVYILLEVCKARRVEFAICAPNLRVDREDLRSDTLSYPAFFAAVSRALVAIERSGNAQLTIDDAILYDYGMRMGRLAFDLDGKAATLFYSYLILAQGQLRSLTRWGHLMTSKDQQDYTAQLERMRASIQHWLYSTLVFASGLFVGVDQSQPLHNSDQQISRETAGFPMPQQIADLTLAEVEDFVAAMAPVLAPIFGAVGVCRYPTKPLATAVQVHMVSFSTYLRGRPSLTYPRVIHAVLSGEVPHGYTTIKSERELEENLMGLLRARTRKACLLPREHGPVNWYSAPLSLEGVPFRFPWSQEFVRKAIRASTSAGPPVDPLYCFKCIAFPNRYWKEPLGWPRAKPVGRAPEVFNRQIQHLESAQIPGWIEGAAQIRQRNLQSRVIPFPRKSAWKPTGKMTMSGDMSIVQHDGINSVLGSTERARWEEYCLELEIASFPKWKRACELWSQSGWISRRVALAVEGRAEIARQQAFAPTMLAPTMAMSLDLPISLPITINLPTHNLEPDPVGPSSSRTSLQSSQQQSGEHTAELTPNAALV